MAHARNARRGGMALARASRLTLSARAAVQQLPLPPVPLVRRPAMLVFALPVRGSIPALFSLARTTTAVRGDGQI
jgi:hypothetical protein